MLIKQARASWETHYILSYEKRVAVGNPTKVSGLIVHAQSGGTHSCRHMHIAQPCLMQEPWTRYSWIRGPTTCLWTTRSDALEVMGIKTSKRCNEDSIEAFFNVERFGVFVTVGSFVAFVIGCPFGIGFYRSCKRRVRYHCGRWPNEGLVCMTNLNQLDHTHTIPHITWSNLT